MKSEQEMSKKELENHLWAKRVGGNIGLILIKYFRYMPYALYFIIAPFFIHTDEKIFGGFILLLAVSFCLKIIQKHLDYYIKHDAPKMLMQKYKEMHLVSNAQVHKIRQASIQEDRKIRRLMQKEARNGTSIAGIGIHENYPYEMMMEFSQFPSSLALIPVIKGNGMILPALIKPNDNEHGKVVAVGLQKILDRNSPKICFEINNEEIIVDNPYYFPQELFDAATIKFQCEGHSHERKIQVLFKDITFEPMFHYPFYLYISTNGKRLKKHGTVLHGRYDENNKVMEIPLAIKKSDISGASSIELHLGYGKVRTTLPKPTIICHA